MLDNFDLSDLSVCYRYIKHQLAAESFCAAAMGAVTDINGKSCTGCSFHCFIPGQCVFNSCQHSSACSCSAADGIYLALSLNDRRDKLLKGAFCNKGSFVA